MNDTTVTTARRGALSGHDASTTPLAEYRRDENFRESNPMLLHEELARSRMRDYQRQAERDRLAKRVVAARRWDRLAAWSARRALAAHDRLP
jgi:hypothetical protein